MANEKLKDLLDENQLNKVAIEAKELLKKVRMQCSNWENALRQGCLDYCSNHSPEEVVAFAATLSLHTFVLYKGEVYIKLLRNNLIIKQIARFSSTKDHFKVRVEGLEGYSFLEIVIADDPTA